MMVPSIWISVAVNQKWYSVQKGQGMPLSNVRADFVLFSARCLPSLNGNAVRLDAKTLATNKTKSARVSDIFCLISFYSSFEYKKKQQQNSVVICRQNISDARYAKVYTLFLETFIGFILQRGAMPPFDSPFSPKYVFSIFWGTLGDAAL